MKMVQPILAGFLCLQMAAVFFGNSQALAWTEGLKHIDIYEKWKKQNLKGETALYPETVLGPERSIKNQIDNQALFEKYCVGDASSADVPKPNYQNEKVQRAGKILSKVADLNFYFYSDIKFIYQKGAGEAPAGMTTNAHLFLAQTCGEFRDRAELLEAKINWVNNMIMLKDEPQKTEVDLKANIWTQLSGQSYNRYLQLSKQIYALKKQKASTDDKVAKGLHKDADEPVDGFSVCETKFIIGVLIAKSREVADLESYNGEYQSFAKNCTQADLDFYYNFRGDSNFKQYSPEANAMIWQAISIARFCETPKKANGQSNVITDQVCENYFKKPFLNRYAAARSGLGAWLLYTDSDESAFANPQSVVTVFPSFDSKEVGYRPFRMNLGDKKFEDQKSLLSPGLGLNELYGIGTGSASLGKAFERLRNAVNRHTNWYASKFDDQLGHKKSKREQAYSPFVASSYEMSESNGFTECGVTVQCEGDGRKAWMLIFKVHKSHWYNTRNLMNNEAINFDRMWLDETSFGTDPLADKEKAWDRLGTALEDELDSILYLHNLEAGTGRPVGNDTFE